MANLNLTSGTLDVVAEQGKTWTVALRFPTGTDLTGFDARWQMRTSAQASQVTLDATLGSGITIDSNVLTLTVPSTVTALVEARRYVHGFELVEPSGTKPSFVDGSWTVQASVVR